MKYISTPEDIKRGKRIRLLRMQHGLTQADLARELKVSVTTVCGWEAGKRISVKHWHELCRLFGIPCDVIGEESSGLTDDLKFQVNFLKQLGLCHDCQQKVEEAIELYYGERDPFQKSVVSPKPLCP